MPSTTVTAFHVIQGRVEYESVIPQGTDEGLDLWEANLGTESYENPHDGGGLVL